MHNYKVYLLGDDTNIIKFDSKQTFAPSDQPETVQFPSHALEQTHPLNRSLLEDPANHSVSEKCCRQEH